jgi:hypothetical protein
MSLERGKTTGFTTTSQGKCFLAWLLARGAIARRVVNGLEANVLSRCLTGRSARLIALAGLNLVI